MEFHFDSMGTTEEQERYCPGGFHPIAIGDMLDSQAGLAPSERRYRILHKLGFGSYATVWIARDIRSNTFVAVKVTTADSGTAEEREAKMLEKVARVQGDTTPTHILRLHDHFTVTGPNGVHHVLVTDVVVPVLSVGIRNTPSEWRKATARGLVLGVAQMHRHGVKHGDLHLGNLGCAMPELDDQEEDDVVQDLSPYEMTVVLPRDPRAQTASLPPYVVMPCYLAKYWTRIRSSGPPDVKILDFGNAREMHEPAGELQCAVEACAPELAFARVALKEANPEWGASSDVWAVGTTIYEIVTGSSLFYGMGIADGLLKTMVKLTGAVPPAWRSYWQSRLYLQGTEVSSQTATEEWECRRASLRAGCADDADADQLVQLLRRVLVLDPEERPTIDEVLQDPWFQDAI